MIDFRTGKASATRSRARASLTRILTLSTPLVFSPCLRLSSDSLLNAVGFRPYLEIRCTTFRNSPLTHV
ncbi:hypothetical protein L226DRAFT_219306 [Lentinus tigrinus ALCF2SS1-7]|uniref:uncharacterized protein n=1 Tax=Lentinus tigrinus ALCF2SS1-7 TaxID=1328758 RepID=UPI001166246C|nr:hypothetical protein L226DRAFT_231261 [Lentinus tigrinus ALCF2SS1-7]RPD70745.1 hypothetical protein L226DRAFT_219306 [Lentinus tigrinus ALCF2SS1-7]